MYDNEKYGKQGMDADKELQGEIRVDVRLLMRAIGDVLKDVQLSWDRVRDKDVACCKEVTKCAFDRNIFKMEKTLDLLERW